MFERCLYYNISALNRQISRIWQQEFSKIGLPPSHGYLLFALVEEKGISQKELSELLVLDPSTMTRFIDSLSHKGLIIKEGKGKGSQIKVTPMGKNLYKKIKSTMDTLYKQMQKKLGTQEFASFVNEVKEVRESFSEDI